VNYNYKVTFVRDALIATVAVVGLYLLGEGVQFQPLQIPWYLLVVGFDVLEAVFGSAGQNYDVLFAAYLVGLGVVGGLVASLVRGQMGERIRRPDSARAALRLGVAGALAVVGVISLLFASVVLLGTSQLAPVLITGVTGLVMLGVAGWLAGVFDSRDGRTA
jgi:mannose/fructose/N-acetylgalactosamine-specific phosphotransferase system component IID